MKLWKCSWAMLLLLALNVMSTELSVYPEGGLRSRWLWILKDGGKQGQHQQTERWANVDFEKNSTRYFRKVLILDDEPTGGEFKIITDDSGELNINGKSPKRIKLAQSAVTIPTRAYSLDGMLHKGKNILSIAVGNGLSEAGFIITGTINFANGKTMDLVTDTSWKCHKTSSPGWQDADFDDSAWQTAYDLGDATISPWTSLSNVESHFMTPGERAHLEAAMAAATDVGFLNDQPKWRAKLVHSDTQVGLAINGKLTPPQLCVLTAAPWNPNAARMVMNFREAGVNWVEWGVGFLGMMNPDGSYDFSKFDLNIRRILTLNPDAFINLRLRFERSPEWWEKAYPDELIEYASGSGEYEAEQAHRFRSASMASMPWREKMRDTLSHFMEYMKAQPWSKRIVGIRVSYGVYSEWHTYGLEHDMPDTGKAMTKAFRRYLAKKYTTDEALQKAWNDSSVTLETAKVPGAEARFGRNLYLRDGAFDQAVLDYYDCHGNEVSDTLLNAAQTVKAADPDLLVGAYYGYTFGMPYGPEGQTVGLEKVLASKSIDFLSQPYIYLDQRRAGGDGLPRTIPSLFRRYGKLFLMEDDTRTHLAQKPNYRDAENLTESVALLRRNIATAFLEGGGIQYLEFGSGANSRSWLDDPVLMSQVKSGQEIWFDFYKHPQPNDKKIAVIFDPSELMRSGYPVAPGTFTDAIGNLSMLALHRSGFVFDLLTPQDFVSSDHPYELAVFLNLFSASPEVIASVEKRLTAPAMKRIYWIYAPGLASERSFSDALMQRLTGINLKHDLASGAAQIFVGNNFYGIRSGNEYLPVAPRIYADDPAANTMGKYENGRSAWVRKTLPNGKIAYFSGVPIADETIWKALFADARIHGYTNPGTVVQANHNTILYHSKSGSITAALPRSAERVVDLFENKEIGRSLSVFKLNEDGPHTWLLRME